MMKFIKNSLFLALVVLASALSAQQVAPPESGTFILTNATIETITNGQQKGDILIQDGKIAQIGGNLSRPAGAKVVDCAGLTVYPGLIDSGTRLGLAEIGSISLTQDYNELGSVTPQMQALTAVNPSSVNIPVTRTNGITTVIAAPSGGRFPGTAALINLHGYTPDQMYAGFKAVVMNFPSTGRRGRWDRRSDEDIKKDEEKALKEITELWDEMAVYHRIDSVGGQPDYNPAMETLLPVYRGEAVLMVEANKAKDIESALKWIDEKGIKAILTGAAEGWRVADKIADSGIPVITGPILNTPTRSSDRFDKAYANAGLMQKAGVKVAIRTNETENVRNLPFNAGFAAAYGMGKEEALKAVTIVPAEIFGVSDQLGSIEVGKVANLFVTDGDPFETKTQVQHLFISGWKIPMENRHTLLYDEFLERSPGLTK